MWKDNFFAEDIGWLVYQDVNIIPIIDLYESSNGFIYWITFLYRLDV